MSKNILKRVLVTFALLLTTLTAQDKVDAIEAARQAKAAAEKATAAAEAATDAAINQAASQAADNARAKMKQGKLDKEARIAAEIAAAEEAELDAAASAAAEDAKRKMAQELGLEYESPVSEEDSLVQDSTLTVPEEIVAKEKLGWNFGLAASVGLVKGSTFSKVPTGGTVVLTTPLSFEVGPLDYTVSFGLGGYTGENNLVSFNPIFAGIGGNLTFAEMIFAEGHLGVVGEGLGFRGFAGITLEKLFSKGLSLPVNVLVGSELFYSSDMAGAGNASYWGSLGLRLDYAF